ncbi:MAG: hypothetical protein KKD77_22100 [Gammaproteobacteria bacterium]|nr:hypothetical protein [Gammaproteobacteria bacterium]
MKIHIKVCLETDWYSCEDFKWMQAEVSIRPFVPGEDNNFAELVTNIPVKLIDRLSDAVTISDGAI